MSLASVRPAVRFASLLLLAPVLACSDDPVDRLEGSWAATSFSAGGTDYIDEGMAVDLTIRSDGTYTIEFSGDLIGACEPDPDCTQTGEWIATDTEITINPGSAEDEVIFDYLIQGTVMTWTGELDAIPVTVSWSRQ